MFSRFTHSLPIALLVAGLGLAPALGQTPDPKAGDKPKAADTPKEAVEAKVPEGPAGNPECLWFGTRIVGRLVAEDLDTAFRHMDLYDRFGCPGGHVQAAFRCLVRQGKPDPKTGDVNKSIEACWYNPATSAPLSAGTNTAGSTGTSSQ